VRLAFILTKVTYGVNGIAQGMRLLLKDRLFDMRHTTKQTTYFSTIHNMKSILNKKNWNLGRFWDWFGGIWV
jgi:hypothetical protein